METHKDSAHHYMQARKLHDRMRRDKANYKTNLKQLYDLPPTPRRKAFIKDSLEQMQGHVFRPLKKRDLAFSQTPIDYDDLDSLYHPDSPPGTNSPKQSEQSMGAGISPVSSPITIDSTTSTNLAGPPIEIKVDNVGVPGVTDSTTFIENSANPSDYSTTHPGASAVTSNGAIDWSADFC